VESFLVYLYGPGLDAIGSPRSCGGLSFVYVEDVETVRRQTELFDLSLSFSLP
jgi:hypothetical protein